jgi:hypothetical protein
VNRAPVTVAAGVSQSPASVGPGMGTGAPPCRGLSSANSDAPEVMRARSHAILVLTDIVMLARLWSRATRAQRLRRPVRWLRS